MTLTVRRADPEDAQLVADFINELSVYEKLEEESEPDPNRLAFDLAPGAPVTLYCFIAEVDGVPVGFALSYARYTTFKTRPYLYLEDFFVREAARGSGAGKALYRELFGVMVDEGFFRMRLEVLKWNDLAIGFYDRMGGEQETDDWYGYTFERDVLARALK